MRINLTTSTDDNFARYAYVMLVSALENRRPGDELYFYLLHTGLDSRYLEEYKKLEDKYRGFYFVPLRLDINRFDNRLPTEEWWSMAIYYRLMLPDIIPDDVDRIIYVDADTIINGPLNDLFCTELNGNVLCACEDFDTTEVVAGSRYIPNLLLAKGKKYFNSGVLLIDVVALKKKYRFNDYMEVLFELIDKIDSPDQDVINFVHQDEIKEIDRLRYNYFAKAGYNTGRGYDWVKDNVSIIHYAGRKPWSGKGLRYDTEKIWWEYARLTPFFMELAEEMVSEEMELAYADTDIRRRAKEKDELMELVEKLKDLVMKLTGETI